MKREHMKEKVNELETNGKNKKYQKLILRHKLN